MNLKPDDDYPDFVIPSGKPWPRAKWTAVSRFVAAALGLPSARKKFAESLPACLIEDLFSAKQGVEDDDLNVRTG